MSNHDGPIGQEWAPASAGRRTVSELIDYAVAEKMTAYVLGYLSADLSVELVRAAVLDCEHQRGRHEMPGACVEQCPRF